MLQAVFRSSRVAHRANIGGQLRRGDQHFERDLRSCLRAQSQWAPNPRHCLTTSCMVSIHIGLAEHNYALTMLRVDLWTKWTKVTCNRKRSLK